MKLICWLVRLGGGKHAEKKTRQPSSEPGHAYSYAYVCTRCGNVRTPRARKAKVAA